MAAEDKARRKALIEKCSTDITIGGDDLDETLEDGALVIFVHEKGEKIECYDYDELKAAFDASKLFYWSEITAGKRVYKDRVYKLPYSGSWCDQRVYDLLFKPVNNETVSTIYLYFKEEHSIGSNSPLEISRTHGVTYKIYTGMAITRRSIMDMKELRKIMEMIVPQKQDYINHPLKRVQKQAAVPPPQLSAAQRAAAEQRRIQMEQHTNVDEEEEEDEEEDSDEDSDEDSEEEEDTALHTAIEAGDLAAIKTLIEGGADINSALRFAIMAPPGNRNMIVTYLLNGGANPNHSSAIGPLILAIVEADVSIVKLLIDRGANVTDYHLNQAKTLSQSATTHHSAFVAIIALLQKAQIDQEEEGELIEDSEEEEDDELNTALEAGDLAAVKTLIEAGADPSAVIISAIHFINSPGDDRYEIVKYLLNNGADPNYKSSEESLEPLTLAINEADFSVVKLLIESGAKVTINHLNQAKSRDYPDSPNIIALLQHTLDAQA